jgi:arsenical pump membrane protein
MTSAAPLATLIFGLTIVLVISRPRRLTEAAAALVGAAVMIVAGLVLPGDAVANVVGHWNVLLFFVGLTGTAAVAERSGLFQALAGQAVERSNGRPRRLLIAT